MDLETTVSQGFDSFMKACFPEGGVNHLQRQEMRRAFYGGVMFGLVGKDETSLFAELQRFKADVLAGRA